MARPRCCRRVASEPAASIFKPAGIPARELEEVVMTLDEFEALRLADLEGLYQEHAAERMAVSRPTFGRILESARRKVAGALVRGRVLKIEGGPIAEEPSSHPETDRRAQWQTLRCTGRRRSARRENPEDTPGNWKGESK